MDTGAGTAAVPVEERGVIWLGVIGACLGLVVAVGVWGYALWRPWFEPWDRPWGALVVMTAPYPAALIVSIAGRYHRMLAALALGGCAVFSAFVIRLGVVGLFHIPAALALLTASAFIIMRPWGLMRRQAIAAVVATAGGVALMLSGAATILAAPREPDCVIRWELTSGRVLWRPAGNEPFLVAQQTPEGFRDDVKQMGLICGLNSLTPREAAVGLAQVGAGTLALLSVTLMAGGLNFLAPLAAAAVLAAGSLIFQVLAFPGLLLVAAGAFLNRRRPPAGETAGQQDVGDARPAENTVENLDQWKRPLE